MDANEPKTYQGLINKKRMYEIVESYDISQKVYDLILNFMNENPDGQVRCGAKYITLIKDGEVVNYIDAPLKNPNSIDGIIWSGEKFTIIPHVVYTSSGGHSSSGWSSGGGSSNNNNNNHNNNNNTNNR